MGNVNNLGLEDPTIIKKVKDFIKEIKTNIYDNIDDIVTFYDDMSKVKKQNSKTKFKPSKA